MRHDLLPLLASAGTWAHDVLWGGLVQTVYQVLYIAGPFLLIGLALHKLESASQTRLARRFGWKSVLWTGWLGTPIHEFSHAVLCLLFRHRIQRVALFEPDPASGRLGYVSHSYDSRNVYQVVGNFFIGVAPFAGGALALYGLLWLFEPQAAREAMSADRIAPAVAGGDLFAAAKMLVSEILDLLSRLVTLEHLGALPFWLFLYLVLCVGSHLAPSPADYKGAWSGGLLLLGLLLLFNVFQLAIGGRPGLVTAVLAATLGPVLALLVLAVALNGLTSPLVFAVTAAPGRR
jgi:hypothetical protein